MTHGAECRTQGLRHERPGSTYDSLGRDRPAICRTSETQSSDSGAPGPPNLNEATRGVPPGTLYRYVRSLLRRLGLDYEAEVGRASDPSLELPIVAIERRADPQAPRPGHDAPSISEVLRADAPSGIPFGHDADA